MTDHETGAQRACLGWCGRGALLSPVRDMMNLKFLKNLQLRLFGDNVAGEPTIQQLRSARGSGVSSVMHEHCIV